MQTTDRPARSPVSLKEKHMLITTNFLEKHDFLPYFCAGTGNFSAQKPVFRAHQLLATKRPVNELGSEHLLGH